MKERRDRKGHEGGLHSAGDDGGVAKSDVCRGAASDPSRGPKQRDEKPEEEQKAGQSKVHGVLEINVVDFPPGGAPLLVESQHVLTESHSSERVAHDDLG